MRTYQNEEGLTVHEYSFDDWYDGSIAGSLKVGKQKVTDSSTKEVTINYLPKVEYDKIRKEQVQIYWKKVLEQRSSYIESFYVRWLRSDSKAAFLQLEHDRYNKLFDLKYRFPFHANTFNDRPIDGLPLSTFDIEELRKNYKVAIVEGNKPFHLVVSPNSAIRIGTGAFPFYKAEAMHKYYQHLKEVTDKGVINSLESHIYLRKLVQQKFNSMPFKMAIHSIETIVDYVSPYLPDIKALPYLQQLYSIPTLVDPKKACTPDQFINDLSSFAILLDQELFRDIKNGFIAYPDVLKTYTPEQLTDINKQLAVAIGKLKPQLDNTLLLSTSSKLVSITDKVKETGKYHTESYRDLTAHFNSHVISHLVSTFETLQNTINTLLDNASTVNQRKQSKKLSLREVALLHFYRGETISKDNALQIAGQYGSESIRVYQLYSEYLKTANRTGDPGTRSKLNNQIKRFENILPLLKSKAKDRCTDELHILTGHLKHY